jgi:hypothetical protein
MARCRGLHTPFFFIRKQAHPYSGRKQVATMYAMTIKGRSVKDLATVVQRNLTK